MFKQSLEVPRSSYLPYPELVVAGPHDGPWTVADSNDAPWLPSNGAADLRGKQVFVPLEAGATGVCLHELAHCHWSPERWPRVRFPLVYLQAVEDARINLGLREVGLPFEMDREQLAHVAHLAAQDAKAGRYPVALMRAIASLGTDAEPVLREELGAWPDRIGEIARGWLRRTAQRLEAARRRVDRPVAPFRVAHQIAADLARDLDRRGIETGDFDVRGLGCCRELADPDGLEGVAFGVGDGRSRYERMLELRRRQRGGRALEPGRMRIARPALPERQPSVLRSGISPRQCRTEGTHILRPDRLVLDRAIFGRPGRSGSGTILIDTSGSMSLDVDQVEEVVRAAGGLAVVAIYSGRGDVGELRIVARGDRRATREHFTPFAGGNVIDLPALEWLAKQPSPRIWVSDHKVTGRGDEGCPKLYDRCKAVVRRAGIARADDVEGAVKLLA